MSRIEIEEKYINGLINSYNKIQKHNDDIKIFENKLNDAYVELSEWLKKNESKLSEIKDKKDANNDDLDLVESKIIEYEKIIENLKNEILPYVKKFDYTKNELEEVYKQIISKYGEIYTEDEIVKYIKNKLKDITQ